MNPVMMKRLTLALVKSVCVVTLLSSGLTACIPLIAGGFAGGALLATDRRTSGAQLEDEGIELRASNRIRNTVGDRVHVNLTSYNRQALLTGEVPTAQDKKTVEQIVSQVENVAAVVNELAVSATSTLTERSSDVLVTGRVKAMLLDAQDLQSNVFKVVTERGTTYLMGRVSTREADRATEVVRGPPGVQKVIRVFEILSEDELSRTLQVPVKQQPEPKPVSD